MKEYRSSQEEGLNCTLDYPLILHLLCSPLQGAPIGDEAWLQPVRGKKQLRPEFAGGGLKPKGGTVMGGSND